MLIDINKYVGLTRDEAEAKALKEGIVLRVAKEDGKNNVLTLEFKNNRVNIELTNGKITEANIG